MASDRQPHQLTGCIPIPLAHYLKALGILRIVAEQADPTAQGWWAGDVFQLRTTLDRKELVAFFLAGYVPTPIVVPWSGSDFFAANREPTPKEYEHRWPESSQKYCPTAETVIECFLASRTERLAPFREMIAAVFQAMDISGTNSKKTIEGPSGEKQKRRFLTSLRSSLPDEFVRWIDAAVAIGTDAFAFNAILGSGGGSDGNSHFSDNFMQSLWICLGDFDNQRCATLRLPEGYFSSEAAVNHSIFGDASSQAVIPGRSPGLFSSQDVGGPNATSGFSAEAAFNPWDYILMLEGCLTFSGSLSRRIGSAASPVAAFPFLMRLTDAGNGTLIEKETSGREIWLPLWNSPATANEIAVFFSEGRLTLEGNYVNCGLDAARAVATYGFDRGVESFHRVGILRGRVGGDNYNTAVSLGRWIPEFSPKVLLLKEIDNWLNQFRRAATSEEAPSKVKSAFHGLESAILELSRRRNGDQLQTVLIALGDAEAAIASARSWREKEMYLRPVPLLSEQWMRALKDDFERSPEFRLAASLAGIFSASVGDFRQHLEPIIVKGRSGVGQTRWVEWNEDSDAQYRLVWQAGSLESNLIAVVNRRVIDAVRCNSVADDRKTLIFPAEAYPYARLEDVAAFLAGETDDQRLSALLRGLILLDWPDIRSKREWDDVASERESIRPSAGYALAKLCHSPYSVRESFVSLEPKISRLLVAGRLGEATRMSARRLRGSSLSAAVEMVPGSAVTARRIAAALLFPLAHHDIALLAECVLKPLATTV